MAYYNFNDESAREAREIREHQQFDFSQLIQKYDEESRSDPASLCLPEKTITSVATFGQCTSPTTTVKLAQLSASSLQD